MGGKLIIEENTIYEIDEECYIQMQENGKKEETEERKERNEGS